MLKYVLILIVSILYIIVSIIGAKSSARYLCRNKASIYSKQELQDEDREGKCWWTAIFFVFTVIPVILVTLYNVLQSEG